MYLLSWNCSMARNWCPVIVVSMVTNQCMNYTLWIHCSNVGTICYVHGLISSNSKAWEMEKNINNLKIYIKARGIFFNLKG